MCGRFRLANPQLALARLFGLPPTPDPPRYNIAPSQAVLAVRAAAGGLECWRPRWGLAPRWSRGGPGGIHLINARAETAAEKPAFRQPLRRQRCVVPADGFYEWQARPVGPKQPWCIGLLDQEPFAFAALWDGWAGPGGSLLETVAILTTAANELMAPIHHRMPVVLQPADVSLWLDPGVEAPNVLLPATRPYPATRMIAFPVGLFVDDPRHEGPACSAALPAPPG